jgi:hypothetical protein
MAQVAHSIYSFRSPANFGFFPGRSLAAPSLGAQASLSASGCPPIRNPGPSVPVFTPPEATGALQRLLYEEDDLRLMKGEANSARLSPQEQTLKIILHLSYLKRRASPILLVESDARVVNELIFGVCPLSA